MKKRKMQSRRCYRGAHDDECCLNLYLRALKKQNNIENKNFSAFHVHFDFS